MFNCVKKPLPEEVCHKPAPKTTKAPPPKPVLLSSQRYEKILTNANQTDQSRVQKEAEEEQKYREYLKKGSDELVAHFTGNVRRPPNQDRRLEVLQEKMEKQMQQVRKSYDMSKENEEQVRREKIAKAQQLIEKLKPGPRELHTAALQSEVLRARNVQRNINEEFEKAVRQNELEAKIACEQQAMPWIQEEQQRLAERQKRTNNYKQELLQTIGENGRSRGEQKKQLVKEQQAAREAVDQEIKAQIEKEKAVMEKKRIALRTNALEAMKMVEQRRMRERMTDEIEDRLCCVYNVGKRQLDTLKGEHAKQRQAERNKVTELGAQYLASVQKDVPGQEAERLRRDISCMQLKFTAEEQEKKRKDKAAKQARIEAYMRELEQQKQAKLQAVEEKRFEMAQRFKNTEVNCLFTEAEKQERLRKVHEVRTQLKDQVAEKSQAERAEKEASRAACAQNKYDKEDRFFFEYAKNLMEDAQKKERPLYPFVKAVQQYKRDNKIDCERKLPRHMVSHLTLGCRQPGDSKADAQQAERKPRAGGGGSGSGDDKEKILENCLKINEIITAGAGAGAGADAGHPKQCDKQCPAECVRHARAEAEGEGADDALSMTASAKVRYSMNQLKKLNQFAAPPLN